MPHQTDGAATGAGLADAARVDVAGYLRRLGLSDLGPPAAAALAVIHRAQVERIAYTTVDINLARLNPARRSSVDPYASVRHIVATGRGGYCFQLNGALAALLARLGYAVRLHRGMVWKRPDEPPEHPRVNHLALTVHALPSPENPGGVWFVDAGLGDALHEPAPLRAGDLSQGPFRYRLKLVPDGWRLVHDPAGSFAWVDIETRTASPADFAASHALLSTSPTSGFVRWISAQRRDATGVDRLLSTTLRRVEGGSAPAGERVLTSAREWFAALADIFGITLDDVPADARAELWRRARAAQEAWDRQAEDAQAEDAQAQAEDAQAEDAQAEDAQAEDAQAEDPAEGS